MANQSAFTSAIGHNATDMARIQVRGSQHVDVLGRGMLTDGTSYAPVSKRQRMNEKMESVIAHPAIVRYPYEGEVFWDF